MVFFTFHPAPYASFYNRDMEYDTDLITDVSLEEVKDDLGDHFYESLRYY